MNDEEFGAEYKKVFDGIHAGDDLKNRVLRRKRRRRSIRPVIAAAGSIAAAIVIFAAVQDYDFGRNNDGIISETAISETQSPRPEPSGKKEQEAEERSAEEQPETAVPAAEKNTQAPRKTTEDYKKEALEGMRTHAPAAAENRMFPQESVPQPETPVPEPEKEPVIVPEPTAEETQAADTSEGASTRKASEAGGVRRLGGHAVLRMNARSVLTELLLSAQTAEEFSETDQEYHTEEWDNDRYFDYIGTDILSDTALGEDMVYTGGNFSYVVMDSSGSPYNDTRIFTFTGENGRYVSIVTSRDIGYVDTVLNADGIQLSEVNGTAAAVFGDTEGCEIYIKNGGTAYIINTEGQSEQELETLLLSIAG